MDGAELDSLPTNLPICRAAGDGSLNELKLLIARGASLSQADQHGNTPLFHAVWAGQQACVEQLLLRMTKYEVNARNLDGNTALSFAVARKCGHFASRLCSGSGAEGGCRCVLLGTCR